MHKKLREKVREALSAPVLDLMNEIEDYAGLHIEVAPNPYPVSPTDQLRCIITEPL